MKVLWFANTPCSAAERIGYSSHRGGWLRSLEAALNVHPEIDLHISFYAAKDIASFVLGRTTYHPVFRKTMRSPLSRYFQRITGSSSNDPAEVRQLLAVVDLVKPDVIHVHGTEENFGLIQSALKLPVLISLQGILTPYLAKYYSGIPAAVAGRYESLHEKIKYKSVSALRNNMQRKVDREQQILAPAKYVIGRTDWDRRVSALLAPSSRYFYNSEILRNIFYERSWEKKSFNTTFTIATISSGALYKGFETIVQTASALSEYQKFTFNWIVIGLDEKSGIVRLVKSMSKERLPDLAIQLLGSKSESQIVNILADADLYCQVSHIENSPNSLCEALLFGMPVIATNAGGTASLLEDGKDGLLVQDGDPFAMAGAILELAGNFSKASSYGRNAQVKARERHNKINITTGLKRIYQKVFHEHTAEPLKAMSAVLD